MDYIFWTTLLVAGGVGLMWLAVSYDIACQWSKNFLKRLRKYPQFNQLDDETIWLKFCVPKFHLLAHGIGCQLRLNLNYTQGAGRVCGEGIEAGWADCNGAALSSREMSPAFRHEVLDDVFGAINWRKTIHMGMR